jgi:membrane protein DedA with SNARE-associated domain
MSDWSLAVSLALATLASEDLAAGSAAVLAAGGQINVYAAAGAVAIGIYVGDLVLFACGRASHRVGVLRRWVAGQWSREQLEAVSRDLDRRLAVAIVASRFVPGTRLPLYVAAGMFSRRPAAFCVWTLVAVSIWTPLLVSGVMVLGHAIEPAAPWYLAWAPVAAVFVAGGLVRQTFSTRRKA